MNIQQFAKKFVICRMRVSVHDWIAGKDKKIPFSKWVETALCNMFDRSYNLPKNYKKLTVNEYIEELTDNGTVDDILRLNHPFLLKLINFLPGDKRHECYK
jgi:hypothetical protein